MRVLPLIIGSAAALQIEAEAETGAAMDESYHDGQPEQQHIDAVYNTAYGVLYDLYNVHHYLMHLEELDQSLDGSTKRLKKAERKLDKAKAKQKKFTKKVAKKQARLEKIDKAVHKLHESFEQSLGKLHKDQKKTTKKLNKYHDLNV